MRIPDADFQAAMLSRLDTARESLDRIGAETNHVHSALAMLETALHNCYKQLRLARERLVEHQEPYT